MHNKHSKSFPHQYIFCLFILREHALNLNPLTSSYPRQRSKHFFPEYIHNLRIKFMYGGFALLVSICESVYHAHGSCSSTVLHSPYSCQPPLKQSNNKKLGQQKRCFITSMMGGDRLSKHV